MIRMIYDENDIADLSETVARTILNLDPYRYYFDIIATRGVSGLIVASPVSIALGKKLVVIRKPDEYAHTTRHPGMNNTPETEQRWIFLDDFVSSGETRRAVQDEIGRIRPEWTYAGDYTYSGHEASIDTTPSYDRY